MHTLQISLRGCPRFKLERITFLYSVSPVLKSEASDGSMCPYLNASESRYLREDLDTDPIGIGADARRAKPRSAKLSSPLTQNFVEGEHQRHSHTDLGYCSGHNAT